jgi:hypothetical protein
MANTATHPFFAMQSTYSQRPVIHSEMSEVLTLCRLPDSIDIAKMKENVSGYMESRKAYYKKKNRAPFIEDEFSEFYTADVTSGEEIGGGSCGMDVKTSMHEGIDAMCVIMNTHASNEKSLMQNFRASGANLDGLFRERKDTEAVALFANQYAAKIQKVKNDRGLSDLYILAFVSTVKDVYLVCFKMSLDNVQHVSSGGFVNSQAENCVNIKVTNFINPLYGNVKLYKSKKRLELRLLPAVLASEHAVKIYTMD